MLMVAASRMYEMHNLNDLLRIEALSDVDPDLGINEDLQVYVKPQADLRQYGSAADNQVATSFLSELSNKSTESEKAVLKLIARHLCCAMQMDENELLSQLSAPFSPDDTFVFAPKDLQELYINQRHGHLKEHSYDLDDDSSISSVDEDDVTSASLFVNISGQKVPASPSNSNIMSIEQVLESVDEMTSELDRTSVPTSSLSFKAMCHDKIYVLSNTIKFCSNIGTKVSDSHTEYRTGQTIRSASLRVIPELSVTF